LKIVNQKDFWSGLMFIAFGLGFAIVAQNYDMGTAQRMGPAYFPSVLGVVLALLGALITFHGLKYEKPDSDIDKFHFGPLLLILGAITLFGMLLRPLGLVVSLAVMIGVAAYASHEFRIKEALPLAIFLILLVLAVFIWGLGLIIPIWPAFLQR
jgi:hypothetical protein